MVDKAQPCSTCKEETTPPISPAKTSDNSRDDETHTQDQRDVIPVLPLYDPVPAQITDVGDTDLASGLDQHPSNVGPEKAFLGGVWVKLSVGVTVMSSVTSAPPLDGTFNSTATGNGESELKRNTGIVGTVSPKTVVTSGDSETSDEIVDNTAHRQSNRTRSRH